MSRRRVARAAGIAALALAAWLALAGPAAAHALLVASQPKAGTSLATAPTEVVITYTEAPDPKLSSIKVLDASGASFTSGGTAAVPGSPRELRVPLKHLDNGVYTVAWRTVSSVDGHLASGSFAFGVGVAAPTPGPGLAAASSGTVSGSSEVTPLAVAGRWLLYVGLMGLVGVAFVSLLIHVEPPGASVAIASLAWLSALAGTVLVVGVEMAAAGVGPGQVFGTSLGSALVLRAIPALAGAVVVLVMLVRPARHAAIGLLGLVGLGGMLADVALSHAAAGGTPLLDGAIQLLHVAAAGTWLGGLVVLLLTLPATHGVDAARIARRFATSAMVGIALVAVTGFLRALSEVGTLQSLLSTDFGRVVVAKSALLVGLAGLGALNHFINVPATLHSLAGLRRAGSAELTLAVVVIALSGILVNLAPPVQGAAAPSPAPPPLIVATGADFGTTVRIRLEASPGSAGFNTFRAVLTDYDTAARLAGRTVKLRFSLPARPDVGGSSLDLAAGSNGTYSGTGANLSLDGAWTVTAVIAGGGRTVEIPLELTTRASSAAIDVNRVPGLPTIYTVHLAEGRQVQLYLDPGTPGANELHVTFFDATGAELPVQTLDLAVAASGQPAKPLAARKLEPGHFVADTTVAAGTYVVSLSGPAPDGQQLSTSLQLSVTGATSK